MAFPRRLLTDGEVVVLDVRPHWSFFAGPGLALCGAVALAVAVAVAFGSAPVATAYVLAAVVAAALSWFAGRWFRWATRSLAVTTTRVVFVQGLAGRRVDEVRLDRLNSAGFHQGIVEWLVRSGTLVLEAGGERGVLAWPHTPHPADVQRIVNRQMDLARRESSARAGLLGGVPVAAGSGSRPAGEGAPSVLDQIERLDELCRRGVISPADFAAKKAQLLDRI